MPHGRAGPAYAYSHAGSHGPSRSQLRSHLMTLLALLLVLLYTNWLYQGLRHSAHQQRSTTRALQVDRSDGGAVQPDGSGKQQPAGKQGRLVGSQLTRSVAGGFLFAWGLGDSFRLGQLGGEPQTPQLALSHLDVVSAAASRHSLVATRDGGVVSMGPNNSKGGGGHGSRPLHSSGQLGRGGGSAPAPVTGLEGVQVVQVASGRFHSLAVTADGQLLSWGLNDHGQLGRQVPAAAAADATPQRHLAAAAAAAAAGDAGGTAVTASDVAVESQEEQQSSDTCGSGWSCHSAAAGRVAGLDDVVVVAAAAGRYSSLALDDGGQLWVAGYDGCATAGQLPEPGDRWRARRIEGQLSGHRVVAFDVGYTFWLAATSDGRLFSCDTGDDGYAGTLPLKEQQQRHAHLGRAGPPHEPGLVKRMEKNVVTVVAAGRRHAIVATAAGAVFSWGAGSRAMRGRDGPAEVPMPVEGLAGQHVLFVAAGEYYSLAATSSRVFGWGSNSLCTGTGRPADEEVAEPTPVGGPLESGDWVIQGLAGGYQHAFAIANKPGDKELQELREAAVKAAAVKAAAVKTAAGGVAGVEVVLTDQQRQEQVKFLQQQQQQQQQQPQQQDAEDGSKQERLAPASTAASPTQDEQHKQRPAADEPQAGSSSPAPSSTLPAAPPPPSLAAEGSPSPSTMPAQQPVNSSSADWHAAYLRQQQQLKQPSVQEVWSTFQPRPWHNDLVRLSGDVFELLPKQFNAEQRNPCWGSGPELACLPFFNILGVSKSGTTDLYARITKHKAILPATNKGPHFWDESVFPAPANAASGSAAKDFKAYVRLFSRAADLIRSRPGAITGEASSNTFTSANGVYLRGFRGNQAVEAWAGPHGANVTLPALLREAQPYLRLIVMLRDPVDRYHSAFHYYRWWKNETAPPTPDDFHAHAQAELKQWDECASRRGVPTCVRHYQPQQLVKGMYHTFLQDWLRHWPRQQLLVLRFEDYKAALPEHLSAVLDFLSVPVPTGEDASSWTSMLEAPVENQKQHPAMRDDTRKLLQAFYQPFNKALAQALDDQRWAWEDEPAASPP